MNFTGFLWLPALFFKINYFWLRWFFVAAHGLSLVAASGGCFLVKVHGLVIRWPLVAEHRL